MKTDSIHDVRVTLRRLRRRVIGQALADRAVAGGLVSGAVLLVGAATNRWLLHRLDFDPNWAIWIITGAIAAALCTAVMRCLNLAQIARRIDLLGETRDRFEAALAFAEKRSASDMERMAVCECTAFIGTRDFRSLVRWQMLRRVPYLLVPVIALAMLSWDGRIVERGRLADAAAANAVLAATAQNLDQLAREADKADEQVGKSELERMADQLKRGAEELRATGAADQDEAQKSALRQLSALEKLVQERLNPVANVLPEEMRALAEALAQNETTRDAAAAMQTGAMAEAAKELEESARNDDVGAEDASELLRRALRRLAEQRQLSEQMQQLARELAQSSEKGAKPTEALHQLARMLRQIQRAVRPENASSEANQQALRKLLTSLQNLKYGQGLQREGEGARSDTDAEKGTVTMQEFADGHRVADHNGNEVLIPGGSPDGNDDPGTTASPFGQEIEHGRDEGVGLALRGRLGNGESLSQTLPAAGDTSKASRRYRELYQALAPAAEDAVLQESIPLGSRFFIKRYFESIRPSE